MRHSLLFLLLVICSSNFLHASPDADASHGKTSAKEKDDDKGEFELLYGRFLAVNINLLAKECHILILKKVMNMEAKMYRLGKGVNI